MDSLPTPSDSASDSGTAAEWPLPRARVAVTHLLIVRDVARSRRFYTDVLGARTLMEGPPATLRFYNTWLVLGRSRSRAST